MKAVAAGGVESAEVTIEALYTASEKMPETVTGMMMVMVTTLEIAFLETIPLEIRTSGDSSAGSTPVSKSGGCQISGRDPSGSLFAWFALTIFCLIGLRRCLIHRYSEFQFKRTSQVLPHLMAAKESAFSHRTAPVFDPFANNW